MRFRGSLALGVFVLAYVFITRSVGDGEYRWLEERANEYRVWFREEGPQTLAARFNEQGSQTGELLFMRLYSPGHEATFGDVITEVARTPVKNVHEALAAKAAVSSKMLLLRLAVVLGRRSTRGTRAGSTAFFF